MTLLVSDDRAAELRRLEQKSTPGPWNFANSNSMRRIGSKRWDGNVMTPYIASDGLPDIAMTDDDGKALIAARNALPDLLADRETLKAEVKRLRDKYEPDDWEGDAR